MTQVILRESQTLLIDGAPPARPLPATRERPSMPTTRPSEARRQPSRWFYPAAGLLLLAVTFVGFSQFYLAGKAYPNRPLTPEIRGVLIVHGVTMSAWMVLFAVQPMLVAARRYRTHMFLGRVGAVLAAVIVVTGCWVAVAAARVAPPEMRWYGMNPKQFISVPLVTIALFAGFVGTAIWQRRRPGIHKAMMLLGTLAAVSAPLGRMDTLNNLYMGTIFERLFGAFPLTLALGLLLLGAKAALERSLDRALAAGLAGLAVAYWLSTQAAFTPMWERVVSWTTGIP